MAQSSEHTMEKPGELQFYSFIIFYGGLLFCCVLLIISSPFCNAITSSTSLFVALIAVDDTSRNSGPLGDGKAICGDDEDALKYLNTW